MSPPRRTRTLLRLFAALALLVWALVGVGEVHRVRSDPRFCASSCHHDARAGTKATSAWHAAGHADVACQDCHATKLSTGLALLARTYIGSVALPAHGKATASACVNCHEHQPSEWRVVAETTGHRQHRDVKGVDCLSCHAPTTHAEGARPEAPCLSCHEDQRLHPATIDGAETCLSCHGFGAKPATGAPGREPDGQIHGPSPQACETCHGDTADLIASGKGSFVRPMRVVNAHSLHGGVPCQLCHNPHGVTPKVPEGQPVCVRCHQFEVTQVGTGPKTGPEEHRQCQGCHKPHAPQGAADRRCIDCHEKKARGQLAEQLRMTTTALRHDSCASCHKPHTWKAEPSGCMTCHKDETQLFQTRSPPQHQACTDCHDVHGAPPTGAVCLKCHADTKSRHVAVAPERHKDCTSCHNPHAPKPEDTRASCNFCHKDQLAQVTHEGPAGHTKGCLSCHRPHENPLPAADACEKCHEDRWKVVQTATPTQHRACTGCHQRHSFRVTDIAATCSQCHKNFFDASARGIAKVPHQADCKSCHAVHGEPGVAQKACLSCHDTVAAAFHPPNPKHDACGSCHESHAPATSAAARCSVCHTTVAATAAQWPAASPHGGACTACHQPHAAQNKKTCDTCHASEASALASGPAKHQCQQCHKPHAAPPGLGAAWWQTCSNCHAAKVQSAKAGGPTHSECKNCHQSHSFAIPSCTSCHTDIATKGLHAVQQHAARCESCHDPHVNEKPDRAKCLSCHADRTAHEPAAKTCNTCHVFR